MDSTFTTPPVPAQPRSVRHLLGDGLRRPGGRRALSVLSIVLALAGLGMFAYPFATDLWSSRIQHRLNSQFDNPETIQAYRAHQIKVGQGLTRLIIPKIDVNVMVVEGTTPAALKAGAGHYVDTALPGEAGNVGIAGHRTTYGRPFNRLMEMAPGDKVILETPISRFEYQVVPAFDKHPNPWPVAPTDFQVVAPSSDPAQHWLTLTTCHPKGSAKQRLVLRLKLIGETPLAKK